MKVIILKKTQGLQPGTVKEVTDGYAKNFLIKNGYAKPATGENLRLLEAENAQRQKNADKKLAELKAKAQKIEETEVTVTVKVGDDGRLFGSVTTKDVQDALAKKGFSIDKHDIQMETIKNLGLYRAILKFGSNVSAEINVKVLGGK